MEPLYFLFQVVMQYFSSGPPLRQDLQWGFNSFTMNIYAGYHTKLDYISAPAIISTEQETSPHGLFSILQPIVSKGVYQTAVVICYDIRY